MLKNTKKNRSKAQNMQSFDNNFATFISLADVATTQKNLWLVDCNYHRVIIFPSSLDLRDVESYVVKKIGYCV